MRVSRRFSWPRMPSAMTIGHWYLGARDESHAYAQPRQPRRVPQFFAPGESVALATSGGEAYMLRMTTVDLAEARSRFDELVYRSEHGESFLVVEGDKPLASLGPVPAGHARPPVIDFVAEARLLR